MKPASPLYLARSAALALSLSFAPAIATP
ncbi:MAG: hypothetical protein ACI9C2_002220, partial [Gammaproteobacteria bacterium]